MFGNIINLHRAAAIKHSADNQSYFTTVRGDYPFVICIRKLMRASYRAFSSAEILILFPGFKRGFRLGRAKVLAGGSGFCVMRNTVQIANVLFVARL